MAGPALNQEATVFIQYPQMDDRKVLVGQAVAAAGNDLSVRATVGVDQLAEFDRGLAQVVMRPWRRIRARVSSPGWDAPRSPKFRASSIWMRCRTTSTPSAPYAASPQTIGRAISTPCAP